LCASDKYLREPEKVKPLLPDLRPGYQIDINITRDAKGQKTKSKNSTWITIKRTISPTSPLTPPDENQARNDGRNGWILPESGGIISTTKQTPLPKYRGSTLKLAIVEVVEIFFYYL
jgi:hypothetical protein